MSYFAHESSYIEEGCKIGAGTKVWHFCHVMRGSEVGDNCNIGQNVFVASGVKIGNSVKIQNNVSVYEGVEVEDDVFIGPSVVFTNIKNPRSFISRKDKYTKTLVKNGATIGANATIVCGNTIGNFAMIGAGTVVTNNIPDYALFVGNPGKQIGWVSKAGVRLEFDEKGIATCPQSGEKYLLKNNTITVL